MNKPPGHYRDEKGHEYYWDGQTRSYIPDDSFARLMQGLNRAFPIFAWGYVAIWILPVVLLIVGYLIFVEPGFLLLILVIVGGILYLRHLESQKNTNSAKSTPRRTRP
jgi:hypothetical protein